MSERNFKHLSFTARLQLEAYRKIKMPIKEIANKLGVHVSTIYRELKRGTYEHLDGKTWLKEIRYSPDIAEEKYRANLLAKGAPLKIGKDFELTNYIEKRIVEDGLTPQAVLGEIRRKRMPFSTSICVNTLYSYIEKGVFLRLSLKHLPFKCNMKNRKRKMQVARAPRGTSIEKRPMEISERNTFGNWEMDCVCGKTKSSLLVLTERLTRKEIIMPIKNQSTNSVITALNVLERKYGKLFSRVFKTITVDNGTEFSDCAGLERSRNGRNQRTKIYYCHPYSSYERGSNERLNREIRRKFPKGTDFSFVSAETVKAVEDWINNYPRGVLGYNTSSELFGEYMAALA